ECTAPRIAILGAILDDVGDIERPGRSSLRNDVSRDEVLPRPPEPRAIDNDRRTVVLDVLRKIVTNLVSDLCRYLPYRLAHKALRLIGQQVRQIVLQHVDPVDDYCRTFSHSRSLSEREHWTSQYGARGSRPMNWI